MISCHGNKTTRLILVSLKFNWLSSGKGAYIHVDKNFKTTSMLKKAQVGESVSKTMNLPVYNKKKANAIKIQKLCYQVLRMIKNVS